MVTATEQKEKACQAREAAEKEARKNADEAVHKAQVREDIRMQVFTGES
jgi:hypothetical protein